MASELSLMDRLEGDRGFQKKRAVLVTISLVLLTLSMTGASILEFNTFIIKLTFSNQDAISYLIAGMCLFLMVRYYSYAQTYQEQLSEALRQHIINDYRVLKYDPHTFEITGMLQGKIHDSGLSDSHIEQFAYITKFPFRRELLYRHSEYDENHGTVYVRFPMKLCSFSESWRLKSFIKLLGIEAQHRLHFTLKTRELLDIYYPYALGVTAILAFIYRYIF